jgi:hypothetical protein
MSTPTYVSTKKTIRRFTLTDAIKTRKALRLASCLSFRQRMTLAKAEKFINAEFCLN